MHFFVPKKSLSRIFKKELTKPELERLLENAIHEPIGVKKGEKFELFFENLMFQEKGFFYIEKHCRSATGEIDYFFRNSLKGHPLWEKFPYLFIECKNWKRKVSSEVMDHFIRLFEAKTIFDCCGVFITTCGFSDYALKTMRDARLTKRLMIVPIIKKDLIEMIKRGFKLVLQERCDEIMVKE